jgi:crotonobetainyl-CoA:carnitine CoA-transferase CaiB-like acyl-CoA transferase
MQGIVPKLSRTPGAITHAGQRMGQANEQVFGELLGLSSNQLADLQEKGVI